MAFTSSAWLTFAIILIIVEILLGVHFVMLWLGLSAIIVGVTLLVYPVLTWQLQFIIFGACSLSCLILWHSYIKKVISANIASDNNNLNDRSAKYLNSVIRLEESSRNCRVKVKIDGVFWTVILNEELPRGAKIKIVAIDGARLIAEHHE